MAEQVSSTNLEALRQSQSRLNEQADESFTQYGKANEQVQQNVGTEGMALAGALGNFVNNQWDADTKQAVEDYRKTANELLQAAISKVSTNVQNEIAETQSVYKN